MAFTLEDILGEVAEASKYGKREWLEGFVFSKKKRTRGSYFTEYARRPEVREKRKEYRQRPAVKAKNAERMREFRKKRRSHGQAVNVGR